MRRILITILALLLIISAVGISTSAQGPKRFRFSFQNANVRAILNYFKEISNYTIILHQGLSGSVTNIIARDTLSIDEILKILYSVLESKGYTFQKVGHKILKVIPLSETYRISTVGEGRSPVDRSQRSNIITQIIPLRYVRASNIQRNIKYFVSRYGNITVNRDTNRIIVTDFPENINKILEVIKVLDKNTSVSADKIAVVVYLKFISLNRMYQIIKGQILQQQSDSSATPVRDNRPPAVQQISPLVQRGRRGSSEDAVKVIKFPEANGIILYGDSDEVYAIESLIKKLEKEAQRLSKENMEVLEIVPLKFHSSKKMRALLSRVFSRSDEGQSASQAPRSISGIGNYTLNPATLIFDATGQNALVVKGVKKDVEKIKKVIGIFENKYDILSRAGTGDIVTKVIGIQNKNAKHIAAILRKLQKETEVRQQQASTQSRTLPPHARASSAQTSARTGALSIDDNIRFVADATTNAIIVTTPAEKLPIIERIIKLLDKKPRQVLIFAIIADLIYRKSNEAGLNLSRYFRFGSGSSTNGVSAQLGTSSATSVGSSSGSSQGLLISSGDRTSVIFHALQNVSSVNIIQTPRILTLENREALMHIAEQVPIKKKTVQVDSASTASNVVSSSEYEYKDVGLKLKITPHINDENMVFMDIEQDINELGDSEGENLYRILKRTIKSNIIIKNGYWAILGGLMSRNAGYTRESIPVLGDIPILNFFFSYQKWQVTKRETAVFLTVYILKTPKDLHRITEREFRVINEIKRLVGRR